MAPKPMRWILLGGAMIAFAGLASFPVAAAESNDAAATPDDAATTAAPVVLAQMSRPGAASPRLAATVDAFPPEQRGVRKAAAEGNEALRRYIWRTRMIYNFYYRDFASE